MKRSNRITIIIGILGIAATISIPFIENYINKENEASIYHENDILNSDLMKYDYSDEELLRIAQTKFKNDDYQGAIEIYQLDKMQSNLIAMCNLGFLYTNYYDIDDDPDYDKIISTYNKAQVLQGHRNRLAFYIKYGNETFCDNENPKVSTEDIYETIKFLINEAGDPITKSYIINCGKEFGKNYDFENFDYDYDLQIFYCYEPTDQFYQGSTPPNDTLNSFWRLKSWDPVEGHVTATWQLYHYKYIDELEGFLFLSE